MFDAYSLFGVGKDCTLEELESAYEKKALAAHPLNGGTPDQLSELKYHFEQLYGLISNPDTSGGDDTLEPLNGSRLSAGFDKDKFNNLFERHRAHGENDRGYGDRMIGSSSTREDFSFDANPLQKNFDSAAFNAMFVKQNHGKRDPKGCDRPEHTYGTYGNFEFLDGDCGSFSGANASGLMYTDYMAAHTSMIVDPDFVDDSPAKFKNVDEYMAFRDAQLENISFQTIEERRDLARGEINAEIRHLKRVAERDRQTYIAAKQRDTDLRMNPPIIDSQYVKT